MLEHEVDEQGKPPGRLEQEMSDDGLAPHIMLIDHSCDEAFTRETVTVVYARPPWTIPIFPSLVSVNSGFADGLKNSFIGVAFASFDVRGERFHPDSRVARAE